MTVETIKDTWAKHGIRNGWSCWTCYPNWVQGWTIGYYDYDTQMDDYNMAMFEILKTWLKNMGWIFQEYFL
ncbi:MAG: hypothetical protein FWG03_10650 [Clostridiales bacterium]|nr:hypothetical protein [Clostridiales bacterium]